MKNKKVSINSINRKISSIKLFHNFIYTELRISCFPTSLIKKQEKVVTKKDYLTIEEINLLLSEALKLKNNSLRNHAIIELMFSSGLKVSELINLEINQIDFTKRKILYNKKQIPIRQLTTQAINKYILEERNNLTDQNYLFLSYQNEKLSRQSVFKILKEVSFNTSIKINVSPQVIRNSLANYLFENDVCIDSVKKILRHKNVTTTEYLLNKKENAK